MTQKALAAWARADLVAEVERLRKENEALKKRVAEAAVAAIPKPVSLVDAILPMTPVYELPARKKSTKDCREHDDKHVSFADCVGVRATDKALLVRFADGDEIWIPQGQIGEDSEVYREDDEGTLVITRWIATQKELV